MTRLVDLSADCPDLAYEYVRTDPKRPTLLLLHGMFASKRLWDINRDALSAHFNLVLADLPGHGDSPPLPSDEAAHPDKVIAAIDRLRDSLSLASWCLCGQSFGAGLTLGYAHHHPERVTAQVFTNSRMVFRNYDNPDETRDRAGRSAYIRAAGRAAMRKEVFHPAHAKRFPEDVKAALSIEADRVDIDSYLRFFELTSPMATFFGKKVALNIPTLLINGRHERAFQPYRRALEEAWPALEIRDIEGGHAINIENPDTFNELIIDFLNSHFEDQNFSCEAN